MGRTSARALGLLLIATMAAAGDEPPRAAHTLDLHVVARDGGQPVAGISVQAQWGDDLGTRWRGTTSAQGDCAVPVPANVSRSRHFAVNVWKDGFVPVRIVWGNNREFEFEGVPATYTQVLDRGTPIGGVVRDPQGRPIIGAQVCPAVIGRSYAPEAIGLPWKESVTTDAQGRWRCTMMPASYDDETLSLMVHHPDFLPIDAWFDRGASVAELRAFSAVTVLKPGYTVRGTVVDSNGQPVAGAMLVWDGLYAVVTDADPAHGADRNASPRFVRVTTDAQGRFRLRNQTPGMHQISARARGLAPTNQWIELGAPADLPPDDVPPAPPLLSSAPAPVPRAPAVPLPPGLAPPPSPKPDVKQLTADGPCEPPLVLRLEPRRTLEGRVVSATGQPVVGATLTPADELARAVVMPIGQGPPVAPQPWKTDASGHFRCADVSRTLTALIVSDPAEHLSTRVSIGPGDVRNLTVKMPAPFRLRGTVTDAETSQPIEDFQLTAGAVYSASFIDGAAAPPVDTSEKTLFGVRHSIGHRSYTVRFPETYVYQSHSSMSLVLRVEAVGYAPATSKPVPYAEGEQIWNVALRKHPWIIGKIRAPDGAPVEGAEVAVAVEGRPAPWIDNGRVSPEWTGDVERTRADGRYGILKPEKNGRVVIVSDRGLAQRTVAELAAEPNVTLEPWATIRGQVRVGAGIGARRFVHAYLSERDYRGKPYVAFGVRTLSDAQGRFVLDRVAPGHTLVYRPSWSYDDTRQQSHRQGVDVGAGQMAEVIVGGKGRPVVGKLVRAEGVPKFDFTEGTGRLKFLQDWPEFPEGFETWDRNRQNQWWYAYYETEEGRRFYERDSVCAVEVQPDGSFRIDDVPEGSYRLRFEYQTHPNAFLGDPQHPEEPKRLAELTLDIDVDVGPDDTPLNLGTLTLQPPENPIVDR